MEQVTVRHAVQRNESADGHAGRILIVDDDSDVCELLELTLSRRGFRAVAAFDGQNAIRQVEQVEPDLIILDIMMPETSGWETFERVRAMSDVPVLFLTALASGEYAARALEYDRTDYLRKPYSAAELLVRVSNLLSRQFGNGLPAKNDGVSSDSPAAPSVTAVIPAYNEERFIGSVVLHARKHAHKVIVVDDGSTDATAEIAREAGADVISHETNQGKARAIETGFKQAAALGASVVVMLDADGQHDPAEIPVLAKPILEGQADMVIGSRFNQVRSDIPLWRRFGQHALTMATNAASGVSTSDSQSGFRAFSRQMLEQVQVRSKHFTIESEMQFWLREHQFKMVEAPIGVVYEEKPKRNPVGHGLQVLYGIYELVSEARPLLFFCFIGGLLDIAGILWWVWIVRTYTNTGEFGLSGALIATLFVIIGTLSCFEGIILHNLRRIMYQLLSQALESDRWRKQL